AADLQAQASVVAERLDRVLEAGQVQDLALLDVHDHVADLEAGLLGEAALLDAGDHHAIRARTRGHGLHRQAEAGARHGVRAGLGRRGRLAGVQFGDLDRVAHLVAAAEDFDLDFRAGPDAGHGVAELYRALHR